MLVKHTRNGPASEAYLIIVISKCLVRFKMHQQL